MAPCREKDLAEWSAEVAVIWTSRVLERIRREVLKQLLHSPVQALDVLVGLVGKHAAGHASPDQAFGLCIEEIDNKRAKCVRFGCSCGFSKAPKAPKTTPTKAPAKVIVERVQS